jgi:hypothetical protein
MILHDEKRLRRLHRLLNKERHEQRLRIPRVRYTSLPEKVSWWQRLLRYIKSLFNAPKSTT